MSQETRTNLAIVEAFVAHVRDSPDLEAVCDIDTTMTYGELGRVAGGLTAALVAIPGDDPVVIFTERRVQSVAAIVGTACAGRTVVPLDVAEPTARLEQLVARCAPCVLLDATGRMTREFAGRPVMSMADLREAPLAAHPVTSDAEMMVIFTSGSTGVPKGVSRSAALTELGYAFWRTLPLPILTQRNAVFSPLNFIGGLGRTLLTLAVGQRITLIDPRDVSPQRIAEVLHRTGIQGIDLTPSMLMTLVDTLGRTPLLGGIEEIRVGGESLDWQDVAAIRQAFSPATVLRVQFGASEISAPFVTFDIDSDTPIGEGKVPIGVPFMADSYRLEPLSDSDGLSELILRNVVDGYWRDPELTSVRFGTEPDGRRYWRSGDIVTQDDNGVLHHHGRIDDMVKVNGRLIEPAEAETVLARIPEVRRAVVLPRLLPSGRSQLVAHIEADADASPSAIRDALRRELPTHLVPALLMRHDRIPMTVRGKIDRQLLRTSVLTPWRDEHASETTLFEQGVTALVGSFLGLDDLTADDNLWDMGCDSLASIEISSALVDTYGGRLDPNDLMTAATCRELAVRLRVGASPSSTDAIVLHEQGTLPTVHIICGAGGPAVQFAPLAREFGPDRPVVIHEQHALHRRGRADRTVTAAATRYTRSILEQQPNGPFLLVGHSWGGVVAHLIAHELRTRGHSVRLVLLDAGRPPGRPLVWSQPNGAVRRALLPAWRVVGRLLAMRHETPGSTERYNRFYAIGVRSLMRRNGQHALTLTPVGVPVLYVRAADSGDHTRWISEPDFREVLVTGGHNTMLVPPYAAQTAGVINEFLAAIDGTDAAVTSPSMA